MTKNSEFSLIDKTLYILAESDKLKFCLMFFNHIECLLTKHKYNCNDVLLNLSHSGLDLTKLDEDVYQDLESYIHRRYCAISGRIW